MHSRVSVLQAAARRKPASGCRVYLNASFVKFRLGLYMPPRTNDFQKLVKIINQHLAPAGAKITESAMLYDSEAGTEREVDILVEAELLDCVMKLGIECTAKKRPVDVNVIEGFKEKHRKLGIHQTIAVSENGFTKTAKNYALKNNIKLLTFNTAKNEQWSKIYEHLQGLSMYSRSYLLKNVSLKIREEKKVVGFNLSQLVQVVLSSGSVSLIEFANMAFSSSEVSKHYFKELIEHEEVNGAPYLEVGFALGEKFEFKDVNDISVWPQEMIAVFNYQSKYRNLNAGEVLYEGKSLVVGGFLDKTSGESAHVAIEEKTGGYRGTLEVSESMFPSWIDSQNK